jgi:hypothetical protein
MAWRGSYSGPGATPCHQPTIAKISRVIKPSARTRDRNRIPKRRERTAVSPASFKATHTRHPPRATPRLVVIGKAW